MKASQPQSDKQIGSRQLDEILGDCNCSGGLALGNHYTGCPQSFKAALSVLIEEAEKKAWAEGYHTGAAITQAKETKQEDKE